MGIALDLSSLAFGPIVEAACQVIGAKAGERLATGVVNLLSKRFTDHSARLIRALEQAHERAWRALEIALAGDSFWQRCKLQLASGEDKAFRTQVNEFLDSIPADSLPVGKEQFRRLCWQELRQARQEGVLALGTPSPEKLAQRAGAFARFRDPQMILRAEQETLKHLSGSLREYNYRNLALLLMPREGPSLLVIAVRYFLRRAIEDDTQLFQGLAFAQLEQLQAEQEKGFAALGLLIQERGGRLESLLDDVAGTVQETHAAVLDVKQELQNQGQQNRELYQAVLSLQARFDLLRTELRPRDTLSIRDDGERRLVRDVVQRYRQLPADQRRQQPALLNAIGKLEVAAGAFEEAGRDFAAAAELLPESSARAEAHINAYRAALEQHNWTIALEQLRSALELDSARFAPFPMDRYRLIRILGAGGSGVAFLCEELPVSDASQKRSRPEKVVIKTLLDEGLECDIEQLFTEAEVLSKLTHPGVVRLRGHGFTDPVNRSRPYLVMEHFEGRTLETYIREEGPLSFGEWLTVAKQMAEALLAAHRQKILHRDLKPANVLIRDGDDGLRIQIIDFGLALRHDSIRESKRGQSLIGVSIAGTLEYSAPEQLGRLPGVKAGPYSDVFGFGRTSCYALFQTPQPVLKHWQSVPAPLADLLGRCVGETPEERLTDFADVMTYLNKVQWDLRARQVLTRSQSVPIAELAPAEAVPPRPVRSAPPRRPRPVDDEDEDEEEEDEREIGFRTVVAGLPVWAWGSIAVGLLLFFITSLIVLTVGWKPAPAAAGPPMDRKSDDAPSNADPVLDAIARLKSTDNKRRGDAVRRLKDTLPDERRGEVTKALEPLLNDPDRGIRETTVEALGVWGTKETVPLLLKAMRQKETRTVAIRALARLKDERAVEPIADRLEDLADRHEAIEALKTIGSASEKAMIQRLNHSNGDVRQAACDVLKVIGGRDSLPALKRVVAENDFFLSRKAKEVIRTITARSPAPEEPDDPSQGKKVYLSDLPEIDAGPFPFGWHFGKNGELGENQKKIEVDGEVSHKGIGMHPPGEKKPCRVRYRLDRRAISLEATVAINDGGLPAPSDVLFEVHGDGQLLWKSKPINRGRSEKCKVDLQGVSVLELQTMCTGHITGCHAVWLDPFVRLKDKSDSASAGGKVQAPTRLGKIEVPSAPFSHEPPSAKQFADLLAYWPLDEGTGRTADDTTGKQRPATLVNAEWTDGIKGKAVRILGAGSGLQYGTGGISFGIGKPFTVALWVLTRRETGTLLSQRNKRNGAPIIDMNMEGGRVTVHVRQDGNENDTPVRVRSGAINDGKWHHLAVTRAGDAVEFFLDGSVQGRANGSPARGSINTDLCALGAELYDIKVRFPRGDPTFQGCVDEFCMFRRSLKQWDILALAGFNAVYLTDLPESSSGPFPAGWHLGKNGDIGDGNKFKIEGKEWPKSLGASPPSAEKACSVKYAPDGQALKLEAAVAVAESATAFGDVFFEVLGDGRSLWKSKAVRRDRPNKCAVDLKGVRELELRTTSEGGAGSHAVWIDPVIRLALPSQR